MSSKKGLGSNACQPVYLITPCPAVVNQYFTEQMHYCKLTSKSNNAFIFSYSKTLSYKDHPVFKELAGEQYISYIVVDVFNGVVVDNYFEIRDNAKKLCRVWPPIRSYVELNEAVGKNQNIEWLFKWHLNIVHMTREYLKGGWLYRSKRQKEIETTKDKYVILNKKGFTNILENSKPDSGKRCTNCVWKEGECHHWHSGWCECYGDGTYFNENDLNNGIEAQTIINGDPKYAEKCIHYQPL